MYETNKPVVEDTTPIVLPVNESQVNEKPKKKFKWGKLIGFLILGIFLVGAGYIGYRFYMFKAYRVFTTNVTSRSATISWVTENPDPGMVLFREEKTILPVWISPYGMRKGYDDRDYSIAELETAERTQANIAKSGEITADNIETEVVVTQLDSYWTHHVTVRDLDPEVEYEFMVGDGFVFEKGITKDTKTSKLLTSSELENIETPIPAYGVIQYYDEEDKSYYRSMDSIVYGVLKEEFSEIESVPISSVTNLSGGWYLDLSNLQTTTGDNFFDAISNQEATNISLDLNIEAVWFGEWSKELNYFNIAPSETISIGEGIDKNAEFKGYFVEENTDEISLVGKAYAQMWKAASYISSLSSGSSSSTSIQKEKVTAATNYVNASMQAQNWAQAATDSSHPKNTQAKQVVANAKIVKNTSQEVISIANKSTTSTSSQVKVLNEIKEVKNDNRAQAAQETINTTKNPGVITVHSSSGTSIIPDGDPRGACPNDNCLVGGQCGWVDSGRCSCTCGDNALEGGIGPNQTCNCDSNGIPSATGEIVKSLAETTTVPKTTICSNNNDPSNTGTLKGTYAEGKTGTCFSSGGNCWYGYGYVTQLGDQKGTKCYDNNKDGQWGDPNLIGNTPAGGEQVEPVEPVGPVEVNTNLTIKQACNGGMFSKDSNGTPIVCRFGKWKEVKINEDSVNKSISDITNGVESCSSNLTYYVNNSFYKCNSGKWEELSGNESEEYAATYTKIWNYEDGPCKTDQCFCLGNPDVGVNLNPLGPFNAIFNSLAPMIIMGATVESTTVDEGSSCPEYSLRSTSLMKSVLAEESPSISSQFIYDPSTEIFSGFTPGLYSFEYNGDSYLINYSELDYERNDGEISLYVDLNGDGQMDNKTEKVTDKAVILSMVNVVKGFSYSLKDGYNFLSFPFIFDDTSISMASDLLEELDNTYGDVFLSLSKYDSGKWIMVGSNAGDYDNNDFQLLPGQGYVLKVSEDVNVMIYGHEVTYDSTTDSAPISFMPGWNLVGLYGTSVKSYTAESLLQDITSYQPVDFTAVNVSRWQENRSLYEALQRDEDDTVYGLDFPIELKRSYFVKVTKGEGNWEPGIQ